MSSQFLPDYGLYLLRAGVQPATRLVFFDLPINHLTRPERRMVSITLSTDAGGREYAISFDFIGPRIDDLLAAFPESVGDRAWAWLENPATVGDHLELSPPLTVFCIEATLGTLQQGVHEKFVPLIVRKVTAKPSPPSS